MRLRGLSFLIPLALLSVGCGSGDDQTQADAGSPDTGLSQDPQDYLSPPASCAFDCAEGCEPSGYACAALLDWKSLPHADACGGWNEQSPAPTTGKCTASAPSGEAKKRAGADPDDPNTTILPTGDRAKPAGSSSVFTDFKGQFPTNVVAVPGSDLVVVVDGGIGEQSVRLVDTTKIGGGDDPVVGREKYAGQLTVNYGAVVIPAASGPARLWVSGGAGSVVYAFTIDVAGKKLARDAANDIAVPHVTGDPGGGGIGSGWLLSGMSASPDGKRLVVGTQNAASQLFVIDVDPASATYRKVQKRVAIEGRETFMPMIHPADTAGKYAFVSVWDRAAIDVVDLDSGAVVKTLAVGKAPEAFTAIGSRYLAVVNSDADSISIVDTMPAGGAVTSETKVVAGSSFYGWAPSGAVYDDTTKRLYVTLAGLNAIAAFDVVLPTDGAPTLTPAGMLGTDWWPTAITERASDGALVVVNGKGKSAGANATAFGPGEGNITQILRGTIQLVPPPDAAALTAGKAAVDAQTKLDALAGAPKVDCGGATYDFPVPATNGEGPSKQIKHIVFVVKENKTFDAVYGDLPGVDGDKTLVMAPGRMDALFGNQRKIATTFTVFDNYYTSAEQSIQGHIWTAYGRTTEFSERTWLVAWGRGFRQALMGVSSGIPVEGSLFNWLDRNGVDYDNMGEVVGGGKLDSLYPGMVYTMDLPDTVKGCYVAARARNTCNLKSFSYVLQPNDHTAGGSAGNPTVETYISVGDEGTGILLEGLSRSPEWASTLLVVTEDDPQDGGDHVEAHRTPLVMASPWIKRGYVSKTHIDTASLHKLFAHILGKPYPNEIVARAALPLDAFTSTPDYGTFQHVARTQALACNPTGTKMATKAAMSNWDLSQPDQAPGIGAQVWEILHEGAPPPAGTYAPDDDDD